MCLTQVPRVLVWESILLATTTSLSNAKPTVGSGEWPSPTCTRLGSVAVLSGESGVAEYGPGNACERRSIGVRRLVGSLSSQRGCCSLGVTLPSQLAAETKSLDACYLETYYLQLIHKVGYEIGRRVGREDDANAAQRSA